MKVFPYPNACDTLQAVLDMRQRDSDDHIGNQDSARISQLVAKQVRMTRVKRQEIRKEGEEEKNMQVARVSKRRRGMRKAVRIYSP